MFVETNQPCVRGHVAPRYEKFGGCVECVRENNAKARQERKAERAEDQRRWRAENREHSNKWRRDWNVRNPERCLLSHARKTAKARGLPFDLDLSDIMIPSHCPVLGIPLERGEGCRQDNSPSIDRIVPSRGYVKGNIAVVSWRANFLKSDASIDELRQLYEFYSGRKD